MFGAPPPTVDEEDAGGLSMRLTEMAADLAVGVGEQLSLRRLRDAFGLDEASVDLLLVALAPDVDARFERLLGYAQDDVTKVRPTIGCAMELARLLPIDVGARARLEPGSSLVGGGLLLVEADARPFLSRTLRVADDVVAFLLGDDAPRRWLRAVLVAPAPGGASTDADDAAGLARLVASGPVHVRVRAGASALGLAAAAAGAAGTSIVGLDLAAVARLDRTAAPTATSVAPGVDRSGAPSAGPSPNAPSVQLVDAALRHARLQGAWLVAGPSDAIDAAIVRRIVDSGCSVVLHGRGAIDGTTVSQPLVELTLVGPAPQEHGDRLAGLLGSDGPDGLDAARFAAPLALDAEQMARVVLVARRIAAASARPMVLDDLRHGVRLQQPAADGGLVRVVQPEATWADLIVTDGLAERLKRLSARARQRHQVLGSWGLRAGNRGQGVSALFAGPPGTGKTLSAEVVAGDLGLDLHVVDLSAVVDKYIGETEKNLSRVFDRAEAAACVLLFDEADALFGKRSEVRDARDRYANLEVAYLLQRLEAFDGVVLLASNLSGNLDEAFSRRLDDVINFPAPAFDERARLWQLVIGAGMPLDDDVDVQQLAGFELNGGAIRSAATSAAYLAAAASPPVCTEDLMRGVIAEYRKQGRLCTRDEFGDWFDLVESHD